MNIRDALFLVWVGFNVGWLFSLSFNVPRIFLTISIWAAFIVSILTK